MKINSAWHGVLIKGQGMKSKLGLMLALWLLIGWGFAQAMTAEEECRQRNASSCEVNGLKFFMTEQECPQGAKVHRKLGHEDCSKYALAGSAEKKAEPAATEGQKQQVANPENAAQQAGASDSLWSNPYWILLLIGLVQGMISRVSVGPVLIVALVMPLIATWSMVGDAHFPFGVMSSLAYIAMEWLGAFLYSMAGWLAGAAIRRAAYKILFRS